jgi:energy-converting hydrogenase Eha subunit A
MVNYFLVFYFLGLGLSFTSSTILITLLLRIDYKDHSTKLRIYLAIIDVISSITLGIPFIPEDNPLYICAYNSLYYFCIMFHGFWVFFISLSLYLIIVQRQEILNHYTSSCFFFFAVISLALTVLVLMLPMNDIQCYVLLNKKSIIIYLIITLLTFEVLILMFISFFYIQIRQTLKKEISRLDSNSERNRLLCLRLLGYPILFFIFTIFSEMNIFQYILSNTDETIELYKIRILVMVYYPLFNSFLYGYTKSSRKYLWYLLLKIPDYKESQEIFNDIRQVGLMQDRVFLDLVDISESEIFND